MNKLIFTLLCAGSLNFSCNKPTSKETFAIDDSTGVFKDTESLADSTLSAQKHCYLFTHGRDSVVVVLEDNLGTITGTVQYKYFEKEITQGNLLGYNSGDTIKTEYFSEKNGEESAKDIWFLKQGRTIVEAEEKRDANGRYINYDKVNFENGKVFRSVTCH